MKDKIKCSYCNRYFEKRGIESHEKACRHNPASGKNTHCLHCGNPLTSIHQKKFCSRSCAGSVNSEGVNRHPERPKRYCRFCGKELKGRKRRVNIFCDNACHRLQRRYEYIYRWKCGKETGISGRYGISNYIRNYLIDKYDNKCQLCGWGKCNEYTGNIPLEIHHKDGNWKNNRPENLQLLCPNCHSLTGTYKSAGKGREGRGKYT